MKKHKTILRIIAAAILLCFAGMASAQTLTINQTDYRVLVGAQRPIWWRLCTSGSADNCSQPSNKTVNLSVSSGSCTVSSASTSAPSASFTAPATAGTCTITAQAAAGGSPTTINVTAYAGRQGHRIAPFYTVLYQGQTEILQSLVYGSTDTSVASWSVSPSTGLTLSGSGRSVAVTGVTAGTYTVTATSTQGLIVATATIVVTTNTMPSTPLPSKTFPVDCTAVGSGTTYDVTNQAEAAALAWNSLNPGDTVRLAYNSGTPYTFSVQLTRSGTATQPVRICGVRDPSTGNLPKVSGANAAFVGTQPSSWQSYKMGIFVFHRGCCGYSRAEEDNAGAASYNIIEGLEIADADAPNSVGSYTWSNSSAGVYLRGAYDVVIRGNYIHDNGMGIMASSVSGSGEANFVRRLVIEGNHIANNAVSASGSMHNQYLQGEGIIVQGNYLERNKAGSAGSTLKIRSLGAWVRYNYIEGTARSVDFCEIQDWATYPIPSYFNGGISGDSSDPWTWDDVVTLHQLYQSHWMYGNILNDDDTTGSVPSYSIHYFHDVFPYSDHGSTDTEFGGTLYFYYNSWRQNRSSSPYAEAFDVSRAPAANVPNQWPHVYAVNNAISLSSGTNFKWATATSDRVTLDKNWISSNWDSTFMANFSTITGYYWYQCGATSDTKCYPSAYATGAHHVNDLGRLVTGSAPFTSTTTYTPAAALVGAAQALPTAISDLPPLVSYSPATQAWTLRTSAADIGAIDSGVPPATLSSVAVSPSTASIAVGATQQFTCTATYSDSSTVDCTSSATWASSSSGVATVSAGLATAVSVGTSTITATVSGISGTATLTITPPPPSSKFQGISGWQGVVIR